MAEAPSEVAYDDVFSTLHDGVLRYAYLLVGDRDVARDLTSEAFARMLVPWRRRHVAAPEAYVRRIVVNLVRDRYRATQRREARERQVASSEAEPTFEGDLAERANLLHALSALPPRQRAVVVLRYYEQRSEAEIAAMLGIRIGTVKSTLSRGLVELRERLREQGDPR